MFKNHSGVKKQKEPLFMIYHDNAWHKKKTPAPVMPDTLSTQATLQHLWYSYQLSSAEISTISRVEVCAMLERIPFISNPYHRFDDLWLWLASGRSSDIIYQSII